MHLNIDASQLELLELYGTSASSFAAAFEQDLLFALSEYRLSEPTVKIVVQKFDRGGLVVTFGVVALTIQTDSILQAINDLNIMVMDNSSRLYEGTTTAHLDDSMLPGDNVMCFNLTSSDFYRCTEDVSGGCLVYNEATHQLEQCYDENPPPVSDSDMMIIGIVVGVIVFICFMLMLQQLYYHRKDRQARRGFEQAIQFSSK